MTTPKHHRLVRTSSLRLLPFLLIVLLFSALAPRGMAGSPKKHKKKDYAVIVGTVWGPDDLPVYGVKVKIRRIRDKKPKWEIYSDHHGEFAQRLPVGKADYVVSTDLKDFKPSDGKPLHQAQEVTVHIDNDERVDIGLHLTR